MNRLVVTAALLLTVGSSGVGQVEAGAAPWTEARDRGLRWLAQQAHEKGGWTGTVGYKFNQSYRATLADGRHPGVTGLCLLAFLEAGHRPGSKPYGAVIQKAEVFLIASVGRDGYLTANSTRMKSHGWALHALARLMAVRETKQLKDAVERALKLTIRSQNESGAWRYNPFAPASDLLATVCQLRAATAAKAAGVPVPRIILDAGRAFVGSCRTTMKKGAFTYRAEPGARASFCTTAAGAWAMLTLDPAFDAAEALTALDGYMVAASEGHFQWWFGHFNVATVVPLAARRGDRDGAFAKAWRATVRKRIPELQKEDGSWTDTSGPGPTFATAMGCLILSR